MVRGARRIAAVVLPFLASELVRQASPTTAGAPLAVVFAEDAVEASSGASIVGAVDAHALRLGVRPGMRVSEAMARSAEVRFANLSPRTVRATLAALAEVALGFSPIVEIEAGGPERDTIWIDVTGVEHLFGGEASLCEAVRERLAPFGHQVEVALSDGPFFAQSLARYASVVAGVPRLCPAGGALRALSPLPVAALGLGADSVAFFGRLGVLTLADLMRIDRAQLSARLEPFCRGNPGLEEVLGWLAGRDPRPLVPYEPPLSLVEAMPFEDGVESAPQLVFAARGLISRQSSRLVGRRQATNRIDVCLGYDRAILALRSSARQESPQLELGIDLPSPLSHTDDLFRAVKAKLESLELAAPVVRLSITLTRIVAAPEVQLDLSRDVAVHPDALPALLSELSAEIGTERVGVLELVDDHRPELRSALVGIHEAAERAALRSRAAAKSRARAQLPLFQERGPSEPARVLPRPIPLGCTQEGGRRLSAFQPGTALFVGKDAFTIREVRFDRRLDGVAWWSKGVVRRDYFRVRLACSARLGPQRLAVSPPAPPSAAIADAWVFLDRHTGEVFLHGWWE